MQLHAAAAEFAVHARPREGPGAAPCGTAAAAAPCPTCCWDSKPQPSETTTPETLTGSVQLPCHAPELSLREGWQPSPVASAGQWVVASWP